MFAFLIGGRSFDRIRPLCTIFENVAKAPWDKMREYITGRINLWTLNDTIGGTQKAAKAVSTKNKKAGEDELRFTWMSFDAEDNDDDDDDDDDDNGFNSMIVLSIYRSPHHRTTVDCK